MPVAILRKRWKNHPSGSVLKVSAGVMEELAKAGVVDEKGPVNLDKSVKKAAEEMQKKNASLKGKRSKKAK